VADWRHFGFLTDLTDPDPVALDRFHRAHATVELAIRDLKEGAGLEHVPSGNFSANSVWLCLTRHDPWLEHVVEGVADVLDETSGGLTGSEIALLLERSRIEDIAPEVTKRHRLRMALIARQARDGGANLSSDS